MAGWVAGSTEIKAISAFNSVEVEVEVEAELGKNSYIKIPNKIKKGMDQSLG